MSDFVVLTAREIAEQAEREADRALLRGIARKLDTLIAALAAEEEDQPARSLDDGRTFATRDDRRGLG